MQKYILLIVISTSLLFVACAPSGAINPGQTEVQPVPPGVGESDNDSSPRLIRAAREEILIYKKNGITDTACDNYITRVLDRAGYPFGHFLANDFNLAMHEHLPLWRERSFSAYSESDGEVALEAFLNSAPNQTAFLAQWERPGRHGHVALIAKVSFEDFIIYQAQLGTATPHSEPAKASNLLFPKGKFGDRSRLRLFFE